MPAVGGVETSFRMGLPLRTILSAGNYFLSQHLVRDAGEAVLLLDEGGNLHPGGRIEQGSAGIASHADGDVRLEVADDLPGQGDAPEHPERHLEVIDDVLEVQLALHPYDREAHNLIPRRRDFLHLHLAAGADEEDFRVGVEFLELVRDGYGREDVSARAASADDGAYRSILHNLSGLVSGPGCPGYPGR